MQCLVMEKIKTDSPCNLGFFFFCDPKRWEFEQVEGTSPLPNLYSFNTGNHVLCGTQTETASLVPAPSVLLLSIQNERRPCKVRKLRKRGVDTLGEPFRVSMQWAGGFWGGWWLGSPRTAAGSGCWERNVKVQEVGDHSWISRWSSPKVIPVLFKKYLGITELE